MADQRIWIDVDEHGNFTYRPSGLHIPRDSTEPVIWECALGPFAVAFKDGTPFGQVEAQGTWDGTRWRTDPIQLDPQAKRGHYHYAVAVFAQNRGGLVHLDASSPEIIVN